MLWRNPLEGGAMEPARAWQICARGQGCQVDYGSLRAALVRQRPEIEVVLRAPHAGALAGLGW
jgi:hypothetical protein